MDTAMELEIGPGPEAGTYVVRVLRSVGGGEHSTSMSWSAGGRSSRPAYSRRPCPRAASCRTPRPPCWTWESGCSKRRSRATSAPPTELRHGRGPRAQRDPRGGGDAVLHQRHRGDRVRPRLLRRPRTRAGHRRGGPERPHRDPRHRAGARWSGSPRCCSCAARTRGSSKSRLFRRRSRMSSRTICRRRSTTASQRTTCPRGSTTRRSRVPRRHRNAKMNGRGMSRSR